MTISTLTSRVDYVGSAATVYPYQFRIFEETDLEVYVEGVLLSYSVDYQVSGAGDAGGGNVTFTTAPDGFAVAIVRNVPSTQETDFVENDSLPAETLETALDRTVVLCQQLEEEQARALKLAVTSSESDVELADLDGNAGKFAMVNSTEDGIDWAEVVEVGQTTLPVPVADGGTGQTSASAARDALLTSEDSRTATVAVGATVKVTTVGAPAAGIGTGIKLQAESADENPSDVGQLSAAYSDVGAGTEDSYWDLLIRRAGAALAAAYRFVATGTFRITFTHAATADRVLTLPDATDTLVGKATTDTLTNKTLTTPVISSVANLPVSDAAPSTPAVDTLYRDSMVKGWVVTSGGGTPVIDADLNVSSITDNGTGSFTVNWARAFVGAPCVVGNVIASNGTSYIVTVFGAPGTTSVTLQFETDAGTLAYPPIGICVAAFGLQA